MLRYEQISTLINSFLKEEISKYRIEFRLPAPVSTCSAGRETWWELKSVHPWLKLPKEILTNAQTVIVFALPLSHEAISSNILGDEPSPEWLRDYTAANEIIWSSSSRLSSYLIDLGYKSIPIRPTHDFDSDSLRASWSHRHAGFVCGLGTFGLNNLLITEKGCAVRLGSVITEAEVEESPRPPYEYCLAKRGKLCDACIKRCPIGALDDWSSGRRKCYDRLMSIASRKQLADACGKCSVGIPCALQIP
ncbi:MAG: epoxyqueuosine reductase [Candidatus Methanodesulfokora washburnensis]|jgi:epoxyqueuosine reductase QueG